MLLIVEQGVYIIMLVYYFRSVKHQHIHGISTYTCMRTHTYTHAFAHTHTHIHTCIHTRVHTHLCTYTHSHTHTHTHTHAHTHTEEHAQIKAEAQQIAKTMNLSVVRLCFQVHNLFIFSSWARVRPPGPSYHTAFDSWQDCLHMCLRTLVYRTM